MFIRKIKGQGTLEYALIIAVVVAGLIAMQIYIKRGVQGKLRESTDSVGEQFEATNTSSTITRTHTGKTVSTTANKSTTSELTNDVRGESGKETVESW